MREPEIYGSQTLSEIENICHEKASSLNLEIDFRQSNHEGEIIDWIQQSKDKFSGLIINAAAYTHSSIAIHDALKLLDCPIIELHLSDPKKREDFRHNSYIEPIAALVISGHGAKGYEIAIEKITML